MASNAKPAQSAPAVSTTLLPLRKRVAAVYVGADSPYTSSKGNRRCNLNFELTDGTCIEVGVSLADPRPKMNEAGHIIWKGKNAAGYDNYTFLFESLQAAPAAAKIDTSSF